MTGLKVAIGSGKMGQFDILADGKVISKRTGNFLVQWLSGNGWPDPDQVGQLVLKLQAAGGSGTD